MANDRFDDGEDDEGAKGPEFEFALTPAKRHGLKGLILFIGHSGSGKTYSAMRLARGLVGPNGRIGVLDTEHNRAKHYADEFDFEHASMSAPYSPARYLKALREFERQGIDCMIVDSMSHVQEGEGGLIDMAAEEEKKGRSGMGSQWAKPKAEWKKTRNAFLQSKMHIIFCARAKNPLEADPNNPKKLSPGEMVPIMPKNFEYEVTLSMGIDVATHQLIPFKLPNQLAGAFPLDEYISEASGQMVRQWLDGEKIVDAAFEALKEVGREQAAKGMEPLKAWFTSLDAKNRTRLKDYLNEELKPIAAGKKPAQQPAQGADDTPRDPPARREASSAQTDKPRQQERQPQSPPPPPPPSPPPPAPKADAKPQGGFDFEDEELEVDEREEQEPGEGEEKPLPNHDYPPIAMGDKPNWTEIAGTIADFIEGSPDDVDLIERVYAAQIKPMGEEGKRSARMLADVIAKAKA